MVHVLRLPLLLPIPLLPPSSPLLLTSHLSRLPTSHAFSPLMPPHLFCHPTFDARTSWRLSIHAASSARPASTPPGCETRGRRVPICASLASARMSCARLGWAYPRCERLASRLPTLSRRAMERGSCEREASPPRR